MDVARARVTPARVRVGETVRIEVELRNTGPDAAEARVDLCVHYAKADGSARPRVFRWKTVVLPAHGAERLHKTLSLRQMSTRTHHPGEHRHAGQPVHVVIGTLPPSETILFRAGG